MLGKKRNLSVCRHSQGFAKSRFVGIHRLRSPKSVRREGCAFRDQSDHFLTYLP